MKTNKIAMMFALLSVFVLTITPVFANGSCNGKEYESDLIAGQYFDAACMQTYKSLTIRTNV